MKAVFQRVSRAEVRSGGRVVGRIGPGALVLLGVGRADTEAEADKLAEKTFRLRVFDDAEGKMNLPIGAVAGGALLVVSQFTLQGDARKGNRPSFVEAAAPERAEPLYERYVARLRELGAAVETGALRTARAVELVNDGPVTLVLEG